MRGVVPGLVSASPLLHRLPGVYQEHEFTQRFVDAFDESLAPILATLDSLAAYVDPWLAPADFLDWVAGWVGVELDDAWTLEQRRAIVAGAALVHRRRGTARGIADAVSLSSDGEVTVLDSGGTTWSRTPGAEPPGEESPELTIRLAVDDPEAVDVRRLENLIDAIKPAHVPHTFEVQQAVGRVLPVPIGPTETDTVDDGQAGTADDATPEMPAADTGGAPTNGSSLTHDPPKESPAPAETVLTEPPVAPSGEAE